MKRVLMAAALAMGAWHSAAGQSLGGAALAPSSLPECGPALAYGTACVWKAYPVQVQSAQNPWKSILVAVLWTEPPVSPGSPPHALVRRGETKVLLEYAQTCSETDVYSYFFTFGASCPFPGPPN